MQEPMGSPVTIIVRHPKENPRKCSVVPLKGYVRLAADGPELSVADRDQGILLLDASWRWADAMVAEFAHVPPRSLHGVATAYPRVSKLGTDPDNGLASIEALYAAYHRLGRPTDGLLASYRWADEFLKRNGYDCS
jgi:pre-rRNA-processing protein TSR3